jgi:thiamine pyrophosphate-dependent acetolactate synthase large subunit-like protein
MIQSNKKRKFVDDTVRRERDRQPKQARSPDLPEPPLPPLSESIHRAIGLIREASRIVVLIGAGVSTSCGIPGEPGVVHEV